jgi:hypothetical protein
MSTSNRTVRHVVKEALKFTMIPRYPSFNELEGCLTYDPPGPSMIGPSQAVSFIAKT